MGRLRHVAAFTIVVGARPRDRRIDLDRPDQNEDGTALTICGYRCAVAEPAR